MFQAPFFISLVCELVNISVFTLLHYKSPFWSSNGDTSLRNLALVILIFSVLRFIILLPLAWIYSKDKRIRNSLFLYIWLFINLIVVVTITAILSSSSEIDSSTKKWRNLEILMSTLSIVSICCQVLCIRHLRSSVLPERHVVLDFTHGYINLINSPPSPTLVSEPHSLGIYPVVSYTSLQPAETSSGTAPMSSPNKPDSAYSSLSKQSRTEFISDMKKKLQSARSKWNAKVDRLNDLLITMNVNVQNLTHDVMRQAVVVTSRDNSPTSPRHNNNNKSSLDEIFQYILNLFTTSHTNISLSSSSSSSSSSDNEEEDHSVDLSNGEMLARELEILYDKAPHEIEFFIPQLAVFLLYGSFDISIYLQSSILKVCERSYVFSHKLYWFIRSFSLTEAGVTEQGVFALKRLMASIEVHCSLSTDTHYTPSTVHHETSDIIIKNNHTISLHSSFNQQQQQQNKLKYADMDTKRDDHDDIDSPYSPLLEMPLSLPSLALDSNQSIVNKINNVTQHNIYNSTKRNDLALTQELYYYQQQYGYKPSALRQPQPIRSPPLSYSLYSDSENKDELLLSPYEGLFQPLLTENYKHPLNIPNRIIPDKVINKYTKEHNNNNIHTPPPAPLVSSSSSSSSPSHIIDVFNPSSSESSSSPSVFFPYSSSSSSLQIPQTNYSQSSNIANISSNVLPSNPSAGETVMGHYNLFQKNIMFWDQLTDISRHIGPIHPVKRLETLHTFLRELQSQYFIEKKDESVTSEFYPFQSVSVTNNTPANASPVLYIPLANTQHKILSIIIDECFSFSTKERAPLFLCFEILDNVSSSTISSGIHRSLSLHHDAEGSSDEEENMLLFGGPTTITGRTPRSKDIYIDKIIPFWTNPITLPPFMNDILTVIRGNDNQLSNDLLDEQEESESRVGDGDVGHMLQSAFPSRASTPRPSSTMRLYLRTSKTVNHSLATDPSISTYNKVMRRGNYDTAAAADDDDDIYKEHIPPIVPYNTVSEKSTNIKPFQQDNYSLDYKPTSSQLWRHTIQEDQLYMNIIASSDISLNIDEVKIDLSVPSPSLSPPPTMSQSNSAANLGQWGLKDTWQAVNGIYDTNHYTADNVPEKKKNHTSIESVSENEVPVTASSSLLRQNNGNTTTTTSTTSAAAVVHIGNGRCTAGAGAVSPHSPHVDYGSTLTLEQTSLPATALTSSRQMNIPSSTSTSSHFSENKTQNNTNNNTALVIDNNNVVRIEGPMTKTTLQNNDHTLSTNAISLSQQSSSNIIIFKEAWKAKEERYKALSPSGHLPGWRLMSVIVKSGDDLRQEQCAAQLISLMHKMLKKHATCEFWLKPYDILALSPDCGLIEAVPDTVSLDVLRKRGHRHYKSLSDFFIKYFGLRHTDSFLIAQHRFMVSLASYCIVCYLLSIKDRHNGNILLDIMGHIIHIDFGYILAKSPGGNFGFEKAPFKLTREMVNVMGGVDSRCFHRFRELCVSIFLTLRRHHNQIILLLEMLAKGNEHLDCFGGDSNRVIEDMRQRFYPDLHDNAARERVHTLIDQSLDSWTTTCYDRYQRCCVGIF